ncbi:MAG: hypothetical protein WC216_00850 [Gallionella sp.]|jgi:hypothetical protein
MNNLLSRIPKEYWAYLALSVWGVLGFMLLHKIPYGIDEGAAHALLLVWSVADDVVSPIVTFGLPDFRTLFFVPVGVLWTGSVVAAKVTTLIVMSIVAWSFHAWRQRNGDEEGALLATGLLLISPLILDQIDAISIAPYLLVTFALGAWSDRIYRESPQVFGGMYFSQIFLCMVCTTLHPMGLAYPLVLLWGWYKNPLDKKQRDHYLIGIGAAVLFALLLTFGWRHVSMFANPIRALSGLLMTAGEMDVWRWTAGIFMLCVLALVIWKQAASLWADFLGRVLLLAFAIGLLTGDEAFAVVALTIVLYWGLPLLLSTDTRRGFWGQRGVALVLIFVVSTLFMILDRGHYETMLTGELSARDSLIKALAEDGGYFMNEEAAATQPDGQATEQSAPPVKKRLRVASQWPALTMLACRCDALPLPPVAKDSAALLAMMRGVDYLIFDPRNPANSALSYNIATMEPGKMETVALRPGGVIVQIKAPVQIQQQAK